MVVNKIKNTLMGLGLLAMLYVIMIMMFILNSEINNF
jgi:hypothetical protein